MHQCLEGLALQTPPLSVAAIHRKVCALAHQQELMPPSYSLVYAGVRQITSALTTLAHQGAKAYHQRFDLLHRREAEAANAIWQADHCLLDLLLVCKGQAIWTRKMDDATHTAPGSRNPFPICMHPARISKSAYGAPRTATGDG